MVPSGGFDDRHIQPTVDIHGGLVACHLHNICMENGCLLVGRLQKASPERLLICTKLSGAKFQETVIFKLVAMLT
jgi:hypothetical protein